MADTVRLRRLLVRTLADAGVRDARVLAAFGQVPRHRFVRPRDRDLAYEDLALPLGPGASISQPRVIAAMLEALELDGTEHALEIGSGCGYVAALLAELVAEVDAIEIQPELVRAARERLRATTGPRCRVWCGDGRAGLPARAPFDAMIVSAACAEPPPALLGQLAPAGRLVAPVGPPGHQILELWRRQGAAPARCAARLDAVVFVPLI